MIIHNFKILILSVFIIVADQISKWWITGQFWPKIITMRLQEQGINLAAEDLPIRYDTEFLSGQTLWDWIQNAPSRFLSQGVEITSFFNIVTVWNEGVSFGLFNGLNDSIAPLILSGVALIVVVALLGIMAVSDSKFQNFALALIIGGAIGNVIDRLRFGAVIDFLDFHTGALTENAYHWPAFNIADAAIVIGVGCLAIHLLFLDKPQDKPISG